MLSWWLKRWERYLQLIRLRWGNSKKSMAKSGWNLDKYLKQIDCRSLLKRLMFLRDSKLDCMLWKVRVNSMRDRLCQRIKVCLNRNHAKLLILGLTLNVSLARLPGTTPHIYWTCLRSHAYIITRQRLFTTERLIVDKNSLKWESRSLKVVKLHFANLLHQIQ